MVVSNYQTMETKIQEIWKPVYEFEGIYEVSNLGRVKSLPRWEARNFNGIPTKGITIKERILKVCICAGYQRVTLVRNGILYYKLVHRLVMASFIGPSHLQVDHRDENKFNNKLSNLQYVTCRENNHLYNSKRKKTKYVGVHFAPAHGNKWRAAISVNGKKRHIGYFETEDQAYAAYQSERKEVDLI